VTAKEDMDERTPMNDGNETVAAQPPSGTAPAVKRGCDLFLAGLMLILAMPVIAICAGLVRLSSRGPALYSQTRLGCFGRPFRIWKLRTMTHDCEKASGARWATRNDPRVTMIGKFLRMSHLDELPQLWNVLCGDMSLVGPRPERPEFIPLLEVSIPHYRSRMAIRPGVTGLAQVYLPPDTGIPSVRRKLQYDLYYIRRMGLFLDLRLMLATGLQAIGAPCRFVQRLLLLPKTSHVELLTPRVAPPTSERAGPHENIDSIVFESRSELSA